MRYEFITPRKSSSNVDSISTAGSQTIAILTKHFLDREPPRGRYRLKA
jgi:hypothetical protein